MKSLLMLIGLALLLPGCSDQYIRQRSVQIPVLDAGISAALAKQLAEDGKGLVFVYRELSQNYARVPAVIVVNGKVVGALSNETFFRLALDPGLHEISVFPHKPEKTGALQPNLPVKTNSVQVVVGTVNYLRVASLLNYFTWSEGFQLEVEDGEIAQRRIGEFGHAKFDVSSRSIKEYKEQIQQADAKRALEVRRFLDAKKAKNERDAIQEQELARQQNQGSSSFGDFLEDLAVVMLIGLVIYANAHSQPAQTSILPAISSPAMLSEINLNSPSGARYRANQNGEITGSNGERWKVSGDKISSMDNRSSYQISKNGQSIFGDRGQAYRVDSESKRIDSSDGTSCGLGAGNAIGCDSRSRYQGKSGTQYQYDLSRPLDKNKYSTDVPAQLRDSLNTKPGVDVDRGYGQSGGGVSR